MALSTTEQALLEMVPARAVRARDLATLRVGYTGFGP